MLSAWFSIMNERADDPQQVFVFPSEAVAAQWRSRIAIERGVVDSQRWISWDTFKQFALAIEPENGDSAELTPANAAARLLCADHLLQLNILERFIPAQADVGAFRQFLAKVLPVVVTLESDSRLDAVVGSQEAVEIRRLASKYRRLLSSAQMFEPADAIASLNTGEAEYWLFGTELLEDFAENEALLRECLRVHIEKISEEAGSASAQLEWHNNVKTEARLAIQRVHGLLKADVPCRDIALSLANPEEILPHLLREARLQGVPLNVRIGDSLDATPGAVVLTAFSSLSSSGMAYTDVRDFCLNARIPFRFPNRMRALVAFGRRWRCWGRLGSYDMWKDAFQRASSQALEKEFGQGGTFFEPYPGVTLEDVQLAYSSLESAVRRVRSAGSFLQLRQYFFAWYTDWVDPDGWDEASEREFQRCLEILSSLVDMEQRLDIQISSPYRLFQETLAGSTYVQSGGSGVAVHPYRLVAGGWVPYSFVLNVHQEAVEVLQGGMSFLRDDQQEQLEIAARDATEFFLDAYLQSGGRVHVSGNAGPQEKMHVLPLRWLRSPETVVASEVSPGLEQQEQDWWAGLAVDGRGKAEPPCYTESFLQGASRYLLTSSDTQNRFDFTRAAFDPQLSSELVQALHKRYGGHDYWKCSAASLRDMTANPAAVLLQRVLQLSDDEWEPSWQMQLHIGQMYHWALEHILDPEKALPEDFWESASARRRILEEEALRLARGSLRMFSPLSKLEIEIETEAMIHNLTELLPYIQPGKDGAQVEAVEQEIEIPDSEFAVLWNGRIDRLDRILADGRIILYDYKRSSYPGPKELKPGKLDASDPFPIITQPQMAVYLRAAYLLNWEVAEANYVGLLKNEDDFSKRVRPVVKKLKDDPDFSLVFSALKAQCADYCRRFEDLDFSIDSARTRFRESSAFRQVLRHRYNVR